MAKNSLSVVATLSAMLAMSVPLAHAADTQLLGCWRTQAIEQRMPDSRVLHVNSDCVTDFSDNQVRSECMVRGMPSKTLYTYEVTGPGRYVAKPVAAPTETTLQPPREIAYQVEGDWLTLTSRPGAGAGAPNVPDTVVGLAVRITPGPDEGCRPRGTPPIRVAYGPPSSLKLGVPEGYTPTMQDPKTSPELVKAIGANFLIGSFVSGAPGAGQRHVLVVEDSRIGAHVMKAEEFDDFKEMLRKEIGPDKVSCEDAQRICFDTTYAFGDNALRATKMTTAFVNVKGRVAIIYGSVNGTTRQSADAANKAAHLFAQRILSDNP